MTRDDAKKWLTNIKDKYIHGGDEAFDNARREALDMANKALEQEPKSEWQKDHEILKAYSDGANDVLDKIRADIVSDEEKWWYGVDNDCFMKLSDVLKIINKYKVKSEEV